jgi:[FeFe] hydrogenase H-cluster maturation GTPase HydF
MGLNDTPSAERIHIGIFGKRNAGKSSLINAITGQDLAIASEIAGTTTDPVYKAMEILPMGPVVLIDTPGIDDEGELGELRVKKSFQVLNKVDLALLVIDGNALSIEDSRLLEKIKSKDIPFILVYNKSDEDDGNTNTASKKLEQNIDIEKGIGKGTDSSKTGNDKESAEIYVSCRTGYGINELRELMAQLMTYSESQKQIVGDILNEGDQVILVVPIDKAAPKGRLILPQQMTIRDVLDANASAIVIKEDVVGKTIDSLKNKPRLVITDSQAFGTVSQQTPSDVELTSFSILMARYKGVLEQAIKGVAELKNIQDGDKILISEGCTHHRQCDDIGTVKLPKWISDYCKCEPEFEFTSGGQFPEDLSGYKLIVHCGGCMLNAREMRYRMRCAAEQNVAITNYGLLIAYVHGILPRSLEPFPDIARHLI